MARQIILVDENDQEIGVKEKIEAHQQGKLHRAFSVFISNSKGEILLQQRQRTKYHCAGLWSNTCCSHPRPGEVLRATAQRRLKEEMGMECELEEIDQFVYRAEFDNGLIEYEYDHVFAGKSDKDPVPNSEEVSDWQWVSLDCLEKDMAKNPKKYTPWLKPGLKYYENHK